MSAAVDEMCSVCGFDATEWNEQDTSRTLAHTHDLVAAWSEGASDRLRGPIESLAGDATAADERESAHDRVHRLWHALVAIADLRRAAGDVPAPAVGAVARINRSAGGVPKTAVAGATIGRRGVEDDVQRTRVHHGRPWQALCLWSAELLAALVAEGHPVGPGDAGENLTLTGVDWASLRAGTILDIGAVRCQLSATSTPCSKIRHLFVGGDIHRVDHDHRPGWSRWYASVLRPGTISVGDRVVVEPDASGS